MITACSHPSSLQLVNFHPKSIHSLYSPSPDAYNYVNRSPLPCVHLIREADLMMAPCSTTAA